MDSFPSDIAPHQITSLDAEFETTIVKFENNCEQRFSSDFTGTDFFRFRWNLLSAAKLTTLRNFFKAQNGEFKQWLFTDPRINNGAAVTLRFNDKRLRVTPIKFKGFNVEVEVRTC